MVSKTVRAHAPEAVVILLRESRGEAPGELRWLDGKPSAAALTFKTPADLVDAIADIQLEIRQKARERRQLVAFRKQHADFLRQYSDLRQKLAEEL
jgi:hypothetical protein